MARESASKTIDGKEYEFTQYGAKQGLKLLLRLGKIVGKPVALGWAAIGDKKEGAGFLERDIKGDILAQAVEALMSNASQDEVLDLCEEFAARGVLCDGMKIDFNLHYQRNYGLMFRVVQAALEVQYGNFFDALSDLPEVSELRSPISNQAR